jgi:transcriptional regulator with XRE-family HTH domain
MPRTKTPIDAHVGLRLRLARLQRRLSQEKLGASVGITFQQVQKYERGTNRIGAGRLYQFAEILGVEVSYFFEDLTASPPTAPARDEVMHPSAADMAILRKLAGVRNEKLKQRLYGVIDALVNQESAEAN